MKLLITGAIGFIGANLVRHFSKKGHTVFALGRSKNPPVELHKYAEYICADISRPIKNIDCDVIIHTAALADDRSDFAVLKKVNVGGIQHIYEATKSAKLFIHISSASVYQSDGQIHLEDKIIEPKKLSFYGQSKYLAEKFLLEQKTENKSIIIFRPRAVYGIGDRVLLPRILSLPKKGKVFFPGHKDVAASMTHISNLIYAIELAIEKNKKGISIYNITDGENYQLRQIIRGLINNNFRKEFKYINIPVWFIKAVLFFIKIVGLRSNLSKQALEYFTQANILEIKKIKEELGYGPITNFEKEKENLYNWINKIGVEQIIKNPATLPWAEYQFTD